MRSGRVTVDGVVAQEPSLAVEPGARVTLDGEPVTSQGQAGVLVGTSGGEVPALAHPSELHLAGTSPDGSLAVLLSDERLARRLRALGYDPSRLGGAHPGSGSFRPLDRGRAGHGARAGALGAACARTRSVTGSRKSLPPYTNPRMAVTETPWTPASWHAHEALQQPAWPDAARAEEARAQLRGMPPLVFAGEARALQDSLAEVAAGSRVPAAGR